MLRYIGPGTNVFRFLNHRSEYFWPSLIDLLGKNSIRLNSRNNFNDPYDSRPIVEGDISVADAQRYVDLMFANPAGSMRTPDIVTQILEVRAKGPPPLTAQQAINISRQMRGRVDEFIDQCGIACFSLTATEALLWAHYAFGFSGICFAFMHDGSKDSALSLCAHVEYVEQRPRISIELIYRLILAMATEEPTNAITDEIFYRTLFHKSKAWAYEQEARIYGPQRVAHLLPFKRNEIRAAILGPKASRELEDSVRLLVNAMSPHVRVVRAELSADGFHVVIPNY
jgi:hypothetical protein